MATLSREDVGAAFREAMGATQDMERQENTQEVGDSEEVIEQEVATEQEADQSVEEPIEEEQEEETSEAEELDLSTFQITDLVEAFEGKVDPAKLYDIKVPIKNGEPVSIGQLKDAFTDLGKYKKSDEEIQQQRVQLENERKQVAQRLEQVGQVNEQLIELRAMQYALDQEEKAIDWNAEYQTDPGRAAFKKQQIQEAKTAVNERLHMVAQEHNAQQQQMYHEFVNQELKAIVNKVQDWNDEDTRKKEATQVFNMLHGEYGFTPQETQFLVDHRMMLAFRDLMKYKSADVDVADIKREVKGIKPLRGNKAGALKSHGPSKESLKLKKLNSVIERGKKSTDSRSKASAVSDLLQLEGIK